MTSVLPEPLTPAGCDLRDFPFTPLFRARLFASRFHARATDAEWRAGLTLWLKSWDQVPAGSLPEDDIDLCRLAELGREIAQWEAVKAVALRGWILCSDGLMYHPVVAEGVNDALGRKQKQSIRGKAGAEAKWRKHPNGMAQASKTNGVSMPVADDKQCSSNAQAMLGDDNRQGQREGKKETSLRDAKKVGARKTQVPTDWEPGVGGQQYAKDRGLQRSEVASFRNFHLAKGNTFSNLDRAWMTWCDKAVEFGRGRNPGVSGDLYSSTTSGVSV